MASPDEMQPTTADPPDLGTLAILPIEIRSDILALVLDISIVINEDGSEASCSGRQYLPPALERDLVALGGVSMDSCTYTFRSPTAFHAFFDPLSTHNRRRLHSLSLDLFSSLDRRSFSMETPAYNRLMYDGWRNVFRALPGTIRNVSLDLSNPPLSFGSAGWGDTEKVSRWLSRFSTLMYMKTKGRCRFSIEGCRTMNARHAFEQATVGVVRKPTTQREYIASFPGAHAPDF